MYWLDAFEDAYQQPGTVYLFGKTYVEAAKSYVSCCVQVKNIERHIFVLPRDTVFHLLGKQTVPLLLRRPALGTFFDRGSAIDPQAVDSKSGKEAGAPVGFMDVYEEFNNRVAERYRIQQFKSRRVTKRYAFEPASVPRQSEYLEVKYSAEYPALPTNLRGSTFSHVFGANQSALENLLLSKHIKGPCWLHIRNPHKASPLASWCKVEVGSIVHLFIYFLVDWITLSCLHGQST